jgi:APA family basic amino acid/polyamine antiporter
MGVPSLTANIVNTTIGASIFVLPASVYKMLDGAAPLAFLACALAMAIFVTCFALAGSRVSLTGGPYAYVEVAFGRYFGFLAGLLFFTTAVLSVAAVVNVLAGAAAGLSSMLAGEVARIAIIFAVYGGLVGINVRGVRAGAGAVTLVTFLKLVPLLIFVSVGIFFIKADFISVSSPPSGKTLADSVLLLLFAFFGIEVALIPSGEVKNPARTVPRAIYLALALTTLFYFLIQFVAQGTLGARLGEQTGSPLAQAAGQFLGTSGKVLLLAGATVSSFGFVTSDILSSPRILFAFGRDGILPSWFAHVHRKFHSPDAAIIAYAVIAFALSVSSTFEGLAVMANVAALLLYLLCCAASWELIRCDVRADGKPFNFPGAVVFPFIAVALIIGILLQSALSDSGIGADTRAGLRLTGILAVIGSCLYGMRRLLAHRSLV